MWQSPATTPGQLPEPKGGKTKLIVLMTFDKTEDGELTRPSKRGKCQTSEGRLPRRRSCRGGTTG